MTGTVKRGADQEMSRLRVLVGLCPVCESGLMWLDGVVACSRRGCAWGAEALTPDGPFSWDSFYRNNLQRIADDPQLLEGLRHTPKGERGTR